MINKDWISTKYNGAEYRQCLRYLFLTFHIFTLFILLSCHETIQNKGKDSHQKISSSLSKVLTNLESYNKENEKQSISPGRIDDDGRVQIYIKLYEFSTENLELLKNHGLKIDIYDEQLKLLQGWALPENIKIMSQFDFVRMIDLPNYGYTK